MEAFVHSIGLRAKPAGPDEGRRCVAACLREFRTTATPERRRALWTLAFARWSSWQFDVAAPDTHLLKICWAELDYAVVGYAVECMDDAGRAESTNQFKAS